MLLDKKSHNLKIILHQAPPYIKKDILKYKLMRAYHSRPPYQQNDYVGWILRAKKEEIRKKRIKQMLKEISDGGFVYENAVFFKKNF